MVGTYRNIPRIGKQRGSSRGGPHFAPAHLLSATDSADGKQGSLQTRRFEDPVICVGCRTFGANDGRSIRQHQQKKQQEEATTPDDAAAAAGPRISSPLAPLYRIDEEEEEEAAVDLERYIYARVARRAVVPNGCIGWATNPPPPPSSVPLRLSSPSPFGAP
ncbi:hypothetical protein HPB50_023653 [Hyalomma asiaticum]|uniref:Uncharacterized protein n=1 Tax=Hyalomma asiaticum TaxID=266040 RepID=A0ACB7T6C9_HYAAI|nr:hypothetical protein HPB50_023653 [Hyalomma asiaticum]